MADDYSSDIHTTGSLAIGGAATGTLEAIGDVDWFKLHLEAGQEYVLSLEPTQNFQYFLGSMLALVGADGQSLAWAGVVSDTDRVLLLHYTPELTGDYCLATSQQFGNGGFAYAVKAMTTQPDAVPADATTTAQVTVGGNYSGQFEFTGDRDWIKFHAEAGQHYSFTIPSVEGNVDIYDFNLLDAAGHRIETIYPFEPLAAGDYYIEVEGAEAGAYTVGLRTVADDYARNTSTTGVLAVGAQASGALQYRGDVDAFRMHLDTGRIYSYTLSGDARDMPYLTLQVVDANGKTLNVSGERIDATTTKFTLAQPPGAGDYYVQVYSTSSLVTRSPYAVQATGAEPDDHGDTAASATGAAVGATVAGAIQGRADVDMIKFSLQAGVTYSLGLVAANGTASQLSAKLADAAGHDIATGYSGQPYGTFTASTTGDYYLAVSSGASTPQTYTVQLTQPADDYSANAATTGALALGAKQSGVLEKGGGDIDWFSVDLQAGQTYWFSALLHNDQAGLSDSSPNLRLLDSQGKQVAQLDLSTSWSEPVLSYVAAASGKYYLELSSAYHYSGSYQVLARPGEADDYGADPTLAGGMVNGVAVAGRIEIQNDKDMFKLTVEAGHDYALELVTADAGGAGKARLGVLDAQGQGVALASLQDGPSTLRQLFHAATSGDYYITVAGNNSSLGGKVGSYTVKATAYALDDYGNTAASAGQLAIGGQVRGAIESPTDVDWVKVHLEAGHSYVFDMLGAAGGGGTLATTVGRAAGLDLYSQYGVALASVSSGATAEPRLAYTATSSGDYYLGAHGNGQNMGSYTLAATDTSTDTTAPTVIGVTPAPGAGGASLYGNIVVEFSEIVKLGAGAGITLKDAAGNAVYLTSGSTGLPASVYGHTLTIDPRVFLKPGATYTLTLPSDSVLDLAGNKYQGATSYSFSTVPAAVVGTAGDDYLIGSAKGLTLDGGAGLDTVYYGDVSSSLVVTREGDHVKVATASGTADTLFNVERLAFSTTVRALDIDGHGGQAYRLYQAAFDRAPDQAGVGYWIAQLDHGTSLHDVADTFVRSAEFITKYGADTSNAAFVDLLYHNVLHRDADAGGAAFWLQVLQDGASRADVLSSFSESPENQAALVGVIGNGFSYIPYV
ncbi:DUF4214 domain-containing protein [Oxalobacteraceae bacterium A2-2]